MAYKREGMDGKGCTLPSQIPQFALDFHGKMTAYIQSESNNISSTRSVRFYHVIV